MKRILLSTLAIATISTGVNAQITINSTNLFEIGTTVEQATDNNPTTISIGSSGANQTWDLSMLNEDALGTIAFIDPSTLPGNSGFPTSNIGATYSSDPNTYLFMTKNSSGIIFDGAYFDMNPFFTIPIDETMITFPSTMGTNFSTNIVDSEVTTYPVMADPDDMGGGNNGPANYIFEVKVLSDIDLASTIDAWGDVTTPMGTFASLRQLVLRESFDTTYVRTDVNPTWHPISVDNAMALGISQFGAGVKRTARWWSDNATSKFVLVEMEYQLNGTVNKVDWLKSATSSISENAMIDISIYPNPASSIITIDTDEQIETIMIYDLFGSLIQQESTASFSIEELPSGVYFANVQTSNGMARVRFVKQL
jgi:hypothetical protein